MNIEIKHSKQSRFWNGPIELRKGPKRRKPTSTGKSICPNGCIAITVYDQAGSSAFDADHRASTCCNRFVVLLEESS